MCGWFHQHKWRYSAWSDRKSPANGIEDEAEGQRMYWERTIVSEISSYGQSCIKDWWENQA